MGFRARFRGTLLPLLAVLSAAPLNARVALLVGEPFGPFGSFNPTGHASIYIERLCAETPQRLRLCREGETGVIISRYFKVGGYDWLAMPVLPYLYALENQADIPDSADVAAVAELRDAYRRKHLGSLIPDVPDGTIPPGNWIQLLGAAYDRTIYGFAFDTTPEQDQRLMDHLNDRVNRSSFNLFYRNCADFARSVINFYLPRALRRSLIADAGISTPKQAAKSLVAYSRKRPHLKLSRFKIEQIPGTPPSTRLHGVAEALVRSKKYSVPLVLVQPWIAGTAVAAYITSGRFDVRNGEQAVCALDGALDCAKPAGQTAQSATPAPAPSARPAY